MASPESPRRLGRGLDALLARREPQREPASDTLPSQIATVGASASVVAESGERAPVVHSIRIASVRANPYQPRREFAETELAELEASLKSSGLLQPITVRPAPDGEGYELIAGERRLRAASRLGWSDIAAVVRQTDNKDALTLALVENLQRADLDPVEEADGYQRLIEEFALSQQEVADVVGKERSTVANALRLRQLPPAVRAMLQAKQLTAGHARALLPLGTQAAITELANEIVQNGLSVRDVERRVQSRRTAPPTSGRKAPNPRPQQPGTAESRRIEGLLRQKLQTRVSLHLTAKDQGEVRIAFVSHGDLERVLGMLGIALDD
ncbi:MAG: ParB/RepB/Spo0J family partition protein [Gemmatimonas sp.]